jgi:hypothetical protein
MPSQDNERAVYHQIRNVAIGFGVLVVVLWLGNLGLGLILAKDERGLFGDMFGAVNALFSGLAFVGLIYIILLQSQELKLQREELKLTREEMQDTRVEIEGQKKALELQSVTMQKQQFENTFFQLLKYKSTVISNLRNSHHSGIEALQDIINSVGTVNQMSKTNSIKTHSRYVNSYLKSIEIILKYVEKHNFEQELYLDIFSVNMTEIEYHILFSFLPHLPEFIELKFLCESKKIFFRYKKSDLDIFGTSDLWADTTFSQNT